MAESLAIQSDLSKAEKYKSLLPQIEALISPEEDWLANLSNVAAALKETFNFWWVGFYLFKNDGLVLGPFQGPVACTRIGIGKGVCGTAALSKKTVLVEDVEKFPGHIACSAASKSEIVVPVLQENRLIAVLDIDSEHLNHFDSVDQEYLELLANMLGEHLKGL